MNAEQIADMLAKHAVWEKSDPDGKQANLSEANLSGAYLSEANLRGAYLRRANLSGANLSGADLRGAYLSETNLRGANLRGAYLREAYLSGADLSGAYLSGANLRRANLSEITGYIDLGTDARGYHFRAVAFPAGWQITAGCRNFTVAEARKHWADAGNLDALARLAILDAHPLSLNQE